MESPVYLNHTAMTQTTDLLLYLLRCSLNGSRPHIAPLPADGWKQLFDLAHAHGVVALTNDAIERLPEEQRPQGNIAFSWALSAERTRHHFARQQRLLASLRRQAEEAGIPMVVIKGMSLARLYPRPDSRACGDIDIYFPGNYQQGNALLGCPQAEIDGKHAHAEIDGIPIENHLHFLDLHYTSQRRAERYIVRSLRKPFAGNELPTMANMVYLLMHTVCHLTAKDKVTLRNILDWGLFLREHQKELSPAECRRVMRHIHMEPAFNILTALAADFVGADLSAFVDRDNLRPDDVERMRHLLLQRHYLPPVPPELRHFKRLLARYRRNRQRRWLYRYLPSNALERTCNNIINLFR